MPLQSRTFRNNALLIKGKGAENNDPKTATTDSGSAVHLRCNRINSGGSNQMTTLNFAACECLYESLKQSISFSPTYKTYRIYVLPSRSYVVAKAYFTGGESECPWRIALVEQFAHQDSYAGAKAVMASYAYGRRLPDYVG